MKRLKELRENKKLTQSQLSKILNISTSAVGMYEQGRRFPDENLLKNISHFFNVSIDFLLDNNLQEENSNTTMSGIILKDNIELSSDEKDLIKKYRQLPADRKETVKLILDNQVNAVIQSEDEKLRNA